ncbi:MAG: hypothetical protein HOP12_11410 [Candidatus Eisenbacteria bacterium]|uniref:DUF4424 domain-containing protein n=1 Tax=Eiseniibacteriota bacterium TaxID=2212470 RepID=A0A849SLX4_UNCEI|nr:hypothetical protein [Candidatus Eisenbacteria bacterium]
MSGSLRTSPTISSSSKLAARILSVMLGLIEFDPIAAAADDGSVETVGGAVRLMKTQSSVRMVSETVKARVGPDLVKVDCEFVMKNEGPADTVLVGFPDGAMGPYRGGGEEYEIESFRSWVDGVEVKCQRTPDAGGLAASVGSWWTKRVIFPSGAVRRIRNHYEVRPSWHPMGLGAEEPDSTAGYRAFRYILWTGASWQGTIGTAEIVATLDEIPLERVVAISPEARRVGRSFRWTFHDFEPGSGGAPEGVELSWRIPKRNEGD